MTATKVFNYAKKNIEFLSCYVLSDALYYGVGLHLITLYLLMLC